MPSSSSSSSDSSFGYTSSSSTSSGGHSSSSSSSSSPYLDYKDKATIPFSFECDSSKCIWTLAFSGEDVFAGTGPYGILLKSKNRDTWYKLHSVDDINITALYVQNNYLFIGTSPRGKIYIMDLNDNTITLSQELGSNIYNFCYYENKMYVAGGDPSQIYVYDTEHLKWDAFYVPYTNIVYRMFVFDNKMYLFLNGSNFIYFDGNKWYLDNPSIDNISSYRNVDTEPFVHTKNNLIDRQTILNTYNFEEEEIFDIFPANRTRGIRSASYDGSSLILGSSEYGRIYNYSNNNLHQIFQTQSGNTVYFILNLSIGVNLASIDNKLYLIYCGELSSTTTTTTTALDTTDESTTTGSDKIQITYPQGGEFIEVGSTITIQWSSTQSINDAVKIELQDSKNERIVINSNTSNDGNYEWFIPTSTNIGKYKIVLTWLTAGTSGEESLSDYFDIVFEAPTTTTTTTTVKDLSLPDIDTCSGIPILELPEDECILYMAKDRAKGGILLSTSKGRILGTSEANVNAYLTGDRKIYAEVWDGFGNVSDAAWTSLFYSLYNKIAEINENKEVVKWKFEKQPSAILNDRITGTFLSPILFIKEDVGFWKDLLWRENKPENTEIIICVRTADTVDELKLKTWDFCFTSRDSDRVYGSSGVIRRDLIDYDLDDKYIQFKITMISDSTNTTPSVLSLGISYSTKFSVYFYTIKFSMENDSNIKQGLITANITQPQNTEIKFGVCNTNSSDWNDYKTVELDKFFDLDNFENVKVGIKMISYDYNVPEVAEFALLMGGEKDNLIN